MNKDIYNILNSTKNENIEYGRISDEEVKKIMKKVNVTHKVKSRSSKKTFFAIGSAAVAAAACMVVFTGIPDGNKSIKNDGMESVVYNSEKSGNNFFLSVSAEEVEPQENLYVSLQGTSGCIPYSGGVFSVKGANIKNVTVSIDNGELYKTTYKSGEKDPWVECEYIGSNYTEPYDGRIYYGFYFSEDYYCEIEQECGGDMKEAFHRCYDSLDGAKLAVSVEYEDGSTDGTEYTLRAGKIELNPETMQPNGNISDGSTPYIYGVYFEE